MTIYTNSWNHFSSGDVYTNVRKKESQYLMQDRQQRSIRIACTAHFIVVLIGQDSVPVSEKIFRQVEVKVMKETVGE
jgi:hypothetical protein